MDPKNQIEIIKQGVDEIIGENDLIEKLKQGKKREIKRIFRSLKIKLFSLHRVSYGEVKIGNLKEGEFRYLNENEIKSLRRKF